MFGAVSGGGHDRVVVAMVDAKVRDEVVAVASEGVQPVVLCDPSEVVGMSQPKDLVMLETGGDVAWLTQIVYGLHAAHGEAVVWAFLPESQIRLNPKVAWWDIGRGAALVGCTPYGARGVEPMAIDRLREAVRGPRT